MLKDLVLKNRSYRRFDESHTISHEELLKIASLGRIVPSTANSQAIKFMLINSPQQNETVFNTLGWAGKLKDWDGPKKGERPTAYIILLCDLSLAKNKPIDDGIIAQTMLLGAVEMGYGGCMLGNIKRTELAQSLEIDPTLYQIDLVIALGKPIEKVVLENVTSAHDIDYYRDENEVHHVPKRSLDELIIYSSPITN
ncbi:MAG: nitroreductase family protein [Cellulosilyticum sp.]|nr:nitroreductase family protein [Cellulosilyticum sp.]